MSFFARLGIDLFVVMRALGVVACAMVSHCYLTQIETEILKFPPLQFAILRSVKVATMYCRGSCECKTFLVRTNDSKVANKSFAQGHVHAFHNLTYL